MSRIEVRRSVVQLAALAALAALGLAPAACSIPNTAFSPTPDSGGGGDDDGPSNVLAIHASVATLDVDEGKTADFTVQLTQAPSAELVVRVAAADDVAQAAIALSVPELHFLPSNFDQPQTVTVTAQIDVNAADAPAAIALTADGVEPVTVAATVRDHDKVVIATDIGSSKIKVLNESKSDAVKVHLTHQPAGDVRVSVILGSGGSITVQPSELLFTADKYDVDQVFMFTAGDDANVANEDVSLTFRAAGLADELATLHVVDDDKLNISATPTTVGVNEGDNQLISVTLTKQPSVDTTVKIELLNGSVTIDHTNLTFKPSDFNVAQTIKVTAGQDDNTANEQNQITLSIPSQPTVDPVTIGINTVDDDVQAIIVNAPDPLLVTEGQTQTFGVRLKFQPTDDIQITVTSNDPNAASATPGSLTFTALDYNDPTKHQVTVKGTPDNNLANISTKIKLHGPSPLVDVQAPVNVDDDDTQAIVLNKSSLTVAEGGTGTFTVALAFDPGASATVMLDDDNLAALPIDKSSLMFTGGMAGNWATPQTIKVTGNVDTNAMSETATVTATTPGAAPASISLGVTDATVIQNWGWPTPFPGSFQVPAKFVYAYPLTISAVANLNVFHTYLTGASGVYTMALYTDAGGVPGSLVTNAVIGTPKATVVGVNDSDALAMPPQLTGTQYWIAVRFSATNSIGYATPPPGGTMGQKGRQCLRNQSLDLSIPWPATFGAVMCNDNEFLFNMWFTTYHQ